MFRCIVVLSLLFPFTSFARIQVEQVKNGRAILLLGGENLSAGANYTLQEEGSHQTAQVQVLKRTKSKVLVQVQGGTLKQGSALSVQGRVPASSGDSSSDFSDSTSTAKQSLNLRSNWTVSPQFFTGTATGAATSSTYGISTSSGASVTGFGAGLSYEVYFTDFSVGAEYSYNSYSGDGGGSSTGHEIGVVAGYLLPDLNLKLMAAFDFFGQVSAGSTSATGLSGFKVGAHYFFTPTISVFGAYKSMQYASASVSGVASTAISWTFSGINLGVGIHF